MTGQNVLTYNLGRIQYFKLITALLCEPEEEITPAVELYRQLFESVESIDRKLTPIVDELKAASNAGQTKLLVEYARLFIGPFKLPAPPYASCYLGSKHLHNEVTDWVRNFYEQSGLEFDYTIMDMPDHIAVETEFLHFLLARSYTARQKHDFRQSEVYMKNYSIFFEGHHKKWVPVFIGEVLKSTDEPFYEILFKLIDKALPHLNR